MNTVSRLAAAVWVLIGGAAGASGKESLKLDEMQLAIEVSPGLGWQSIPDPDSEPPSDRLLLPSKVGVVVTWYKDACATWARDLVSAAKVSAPGMLPRGWYPQLYQRSTPDDQVTFACLDTGRGRPVVAMIDRLPSQISRADQGAIQEALQSLADRLGKR